MVTLSGKNVEQSEEDSKHKGVASFYFPQRVLQSNEHYFYSFVSMVAEVGGYVGLLLGVSLFHLSSALGDVISKRIEQLEKEIEAEGMTLTVSVAKSRSKNKNNVAPYVVNKRVINRQQ